MAKFCTKCGSPIGEGLKFCSSCGTPVSESPAASPTAAAAPPTPPPVTPPAPRPAAAAPAPAAPAQKGSPVLKIILIIVLVIFLLIAAAIGACVYIAYRVKNRVQGEMQNIHATVQTGQGTQEGHVQTGGGAKTAAAATQDIPPYPGSTPTSSGVSIGGTQGGLSGQEFETTDSMDKVVAFYKDKLGSKASVTESDGKTTFTVFTNNGISAVTITGDESSGKTKINIGHLGK
jgi:zinc ribbon protein